MSLFRIGVALAKRILNERCYDVVRSRFFSFFSACCRRRFVKRSGYKDFHCFLLPKDLPHEIHNEQFFSQRGQDWFLSTHIFPGVKEGLFLDIGANHPFELSNTYYFERLGWSGIAFEPQPHIQALWKEVRKTPCLQLALGDTESEIVFNSIIADNWMHALACVDGLPAGMRILNECVECAHQVEKINVPQKKLENVIAEYGITNIDFISIDVEGYEMNVLRGIDFSRVQIKCFIIENDATCVGSDMIRDFFKEREYVHIARLSGDDVFVHMGHLKELGLWA